jgi:HSP20 family protein
MNGNNAKCLIKLKTMNKILNQMFNDSIFDGFIPSYGSSNAWELTKTEDGHVLNINVPGLAKEDIEIDLEEDTLFVHGKREDGSTKYIVNRRFNLENIDVDYDQITATCEHGVLKIQLPMPEAMVPQKKSIKID